MLALGITCLVTSTLSGETQIGYLSILMLFLNLFSAVQDIAVDSLAVELLDQNELGIGNTVRVVAYKAGSLFSGGLLLYVKEIFGWTIMFLAFALIYFIAVILIHQLKTSKSVTEEKNNSVISVKSNLRAPAFYLPQLSQVSQVSQIYFFNWESWGRQKAKWLFTYPKSPN